MAEKSATINSHPSFGIKAVLMSWDKTSDVKSYKDSISSNFPAFSKFLAKSISTI